MNTKPTSLATPVQNHCYAAIPVSVARGIGQEHVKDMVIVITYDRQFERVHTTTWGKGIEDKQIAVSIRDKFLESWDVDPGSGTVNQDYQREGEAAATVDKLVSVIRELVQAMRDYEMSVDTDPPHKHRDMMKRAQAAIEAA